CAGLTLLRPHRTSSAARDRPVFPCLRPGRGAKQRVRHRSSILVLSFRSGGEPADRPLRLLPELYRPTPTQLRPGNEDAGIPANEGGGRSTRGGKTERKRGVKAERGEESGERGRCSSRRPSLRPPPARRRLPAAATWPGLAAMPPRSPPRPARGRPRRR